jgi:hypothetical protein
MTIKTHFHKYGKLNKTHVYMSKKYKKLKERKSIIHFFLIPHINTRKWTNSVSFCPYGYARF